ncbi:uncharacterized protein MELLADRAFT_65384 [Melampsora larici-populina 98AG31]|uniref:Uncharacterized protein n=1 Tax=Melampsora larici-populina (strain 98AG31 / pathotype 3-4-7) TaxID=747676 RepID=F4RV53_MELLP|nr:uncharacterized protein MELLADRAFT_65384 [Melampsora larici-populina 98AG31]EGG03559.1 hypothetical protein MELLADRAFT_65384 [Melampsora larici-populina 98AG31]
MGWLTALKYGIRVREEALVNRQEINGFVAPPNISLYNPILGEECYQATGNRRKFLSSFWEIVLIVLDETLFVTNPYLEGGERYGWDPETGKPPKKTEKTSQFHNKNQYQNKSYQKWNNHQTTSGSGSSGGNGSGVSGGGNNYGGSGEGSTMVGRPFEKKNCQCGYFGNNFDENYKEKKAMEAAKNKQPEK